MAYKLVVADSSPTIQKVIQLSFSEAGFEIYPFEDGGNLIKSLEQVAPDAVLLSLSLPNKDGYEVATFIKNHEEFGKIPLFFLRGIFEPVDQERISCLEYDDIIQKPFDSEKLASQVKELIDKRKGPHTFPEEPFLDEAPSEIQGYGQEEDGSLDTVSHERTTPAEDLTSPLVSRLETQVEDKVRRALKEEVLSVERELEKRLKASLFSEFKDWLENELRKKGSEPR